MRFIFNENQDKSFAVAVLQLFNYYFRSYERMQAVGRITKFSTNEKRTKERKRGREREREKKKRESKTVNTSLFGVDVKPLHR